MEGKKLFFIGLGFIAISTYFTLSNPDQICCGELRTLWMGAGMATFMIGSVQWIVESDKKR